MKCPKCQHENPDDAQFCIECGNPMELHCPQCETITPATGKFCKGCGHNLTLPSEPAPKALSSDEKIDKIQRYLPRGLTEKILSQRDKIEGERKQVTVMFCDMEGFTPLSERLGPEEAYSIMDQVYEILIHKVHDYEGTVNEMTGDGIMALFGAPIALEDAPQRAIRSAHAIHREMVRFTEKMNQERPGSYPLRMRIGIHTGPVVVGTLGNNLRVEFKAVGDTVNLASRMEGLAEPGTTYVTGETFEQTEGLFRFEALGEKEVKGKKTPVRIYRVIAPSTRRTRFDVSAEKGLTPFVGRERQLELLLDGFERAKPGRGQAFSIVAEAGLGKSRILYEFRKAVANEDVTFLEGKCLSYSRGVAFQPVIDILKSNFDIHDTDSDREIRQKVADGLEDLGAEENATLPYILELLSVENSGIDAISMSPEARRDSMVAALRHIVLKGSEIRPLIMAFEDLHWIDKGSESCLKDLLGSISGAKVLLIFLYRPEFVHTWGGKSYHGQVTLNRLSNRDTLEMVSHLLGTREIEISLGEFILEKTEGVPLFIEEFIKSLKELGVIGRKGRGYSLTKDIHEVEVPFTIQDVIMARVDSLPEAPKKVLQTAAAIEREFGHGLIKRVTGLPERELLSNLAVLKDSELIYERGIYPQSTYIFKHALTHEVVYNSILSKRKKALHKKIGAAIEELFKDHIDEYYGALAEHYMTGEDYEKAAEFLKLAGRKAVKAGSLEDAISYTEKGIICLDRLPQNEHIQKKSIDMRTKVSLYYGLLTQFEKAIKWVEPIASLAKKLNYKKPLPRLYTIIGTHSYFVNENFPAAFYNLNKAIEISEELNDIVSLATGRNWLGLAMAFCCEFEKSLHYFKKGLDLSILVNAFWGMSMAKSNMSLFVYSWKGDLNKAYKSSSEAIQYGEKSNDIFSKSIAYVCHGWSCYYKGLFGDSERIIKKALKYFEKSEIFSWWG